MKVLCVQGSPRKNGNSATVSRRFLKTAGERGADIKTFHLNDLDYKPCQACYVCKTKLDHCTLKDDLTPVLDAFGKCDLAVVATPVYYGDISAQAKAFIDRTFSFIKPDFANRPDPVRFAPGKNMLWIISQEAGEEYHSDIFKRYAMLFETYARTHNHLIRATGVEEPGEVIHKEDIMSLADEMAIALTP